MINIEDRTLLDRTLPKWPGLTVIGEPVSQEQAYEILVRTSSLWLSTNDKEWERACYDVLGYQGPTPFLHPMVLASKRLRDGEGA